MDEQSRNHLPVARLTPMDFSHTDHIIAWRNDPANSKWFREKLTFTAVGHEAWLRSRLETGIDMNWVVLDALDNPVGAVSIYKIDPEGRKAEFGRLVIGSQHKGRGYGSAAVSMAISESRRLHLASLCLIVKAENIRAISIYERWGFRPKAIVADELLMELLITPR